MIDGYGTGAIDPAALLVRAHGSQGRPEREARMGQVKGDKARYNRERRKKLARRVEMRALRATLGAKGAAPQAKAGVAAPQSKAGAATKI